MISEKISGLIRMAEVKEEEKKATEYNEKTEGRLLNRSSQIGWVTDCPRNLCLSRLCPDKQTTWDDKMKSRLREGDKQETIIRADLTRAGIKLNHLDRLVWEKLELTGELDDLVVLDGKEYPIDYKTCSSAMFQKVQRAQSKDDLLKSPFIWIRHYPAQLQAYMLMTKKELSIILFKDKESGQRFLMDVELDYNYASGLIEGLKYVNECVRKEDPPAAAKIEACDSCPFADYDFPEREKTAAEGIEIITEETWLMKLKEYQLLIDQGIAKAAKEFEALDKEIKEEFKKS